MSMNFGTEPVDMELGTVGDLAEQMVYRLNGCSDLMISKTLQVAFSDFSKATCCFVSFQDAETEEGELDYPISPTIPGMQIDAISEVKLDGRVLENPRHFTTCFVGGTPVIHLKPRALSGFYPAEMLERRPELRGRPYQAQKLRVRCIEIPRMGSENAPRWFLNKYGEAVVALAMFRLLGMSGKPWSDPVQAQAELVRYENAATNARLNSLSHDGSQCGNSHVDPLDTSGLL